MYWGELCTVKLEQAMLEAELGKVKSAWDSLKSDLHKVQTELNARKREDVRWKKEFGLLAQERDLLAQTVKELRAQQATPSDAISSAGRADGSDTDNLFGEDCAGLGD